MCIQLTQTKWKTIICSVIVLKTEYTYIYYIDGIFTGNRIWHMYVGCATFTQADKMQKALLFVANE